jgi:hypothetical protein
MAYFIPPRVKHIDVSSNREKIQPLGPKPIKYKLYFWSENFFRRAEQTFCGYWIRLRGNARICNCQSGKVGSSHYYLDPRPLHEIVKLFMSMTKNILNNWYTLQYQFLILCLILYECVDILVKFILLLFFYPYSTTGNVIWLWSMVSYIKGGTHAKGIWKQDPEANIWAQDRWKGEMDNVPLLGTSKCVPLAYYSQDD